MKLFLTHSTHFDFQQKLYLPLQNSMVCKKHEILFPHMKKFLRNTKMIISSSDVILAETSYPSTGQGIELGWADMYKKPIVAFSRTGTTASSAIGLLTTKWFVYKDSQDMIRKINVALTELEKIISSSPAAPRSTVA